MITITASFIIKPECTDKFKTLAAECIAGSRAEAGNISYNLYVSRQDPNRFCFIENWKDEQAIETHNSTAHFLKFSEGFAPLLDGTPSIDLLEQL